MMNIIAHCPIVVCHPPGVIEVTRSHFSQIPRTDATNNRFSYSVLLLLIYTFFFRRLNSLLNDRLLLLENKVLFLSFYQVLFSNSQYVIDSFPRTGTLTKSFS